MPPVDDPGGSSVRCPPPDAERGDYFIVQKPGQRPAVRAYFTCPWTREAPRAIDDQMPQRAWPDEVIPEGTYLGPVHKVEHHDEACTVMVPHPFHREFPVWIRVWQCWEEPRDYFGLIDFTRVQVMYYWSDYAVRVPTATVLSWIERGWRDHYIFSATECDA